MRVIALPEFLARAKGLLSQEERAEFADFIGANPESGKLIPGMRGVRKIRWRRGNLGKRGGLRIIYLYVVVMWSSTEQFTCSQFTPRRNKRISRRRRRKRSFAISPR